MKKLYDLMKFILKDNGNRNISKKFFSKVGQKFVSTLLATLICGSKMTLV